MSKHNPNDEMKHILEKIEKQSSEAKRLQALKIQQQGQTQFGQANNWYQTLKRKWAQQYQDKKKDFIKQARLSENRHLAMISLFFVGAVYVSWAIEDKYDKLRRRAQTTKSSKQRQADVENQYITRMLAKKEFEAVPIDQEQEDEQKYLYQHADLEFDTKADLMEVMEQENTILQNDNEDI